MMLMEWLLSLIMSAVLVPALVVFIQVLASLLRHVASCEVSTDKRHSVAVLVPAHDEEAGIGKTIASIIPQLIGGDRLLIVADNCNDNTATIARNLGAEVIERADPGRRGKGYALQFGIGHLAANPPDILLVIDADCELGPQALDRLTRLCVATDRPVQALDLMRSPAGAGQKTRIAEFAWVVRNHVRPLGFRHLGLPCQLMGTGMAFPWSVIKCADLANGHIAEDMKLGIDLARAGTPPIFCPDAQVTSMFPIGDDAIRTQRTRWEHGHLGIILSSGPALLMEALRRNNLQLLGLVLDLCVPPLALFCMLVAGLFILAGGFSCITGLWLPLWLALMNIQLVGIAVFLAWWFYGRKILSLRDLICAPLYALWKIPLYLKFMIGRQVEWVRSKRGEA